MPKLYYQGHGSYRISTDAGLVIYIDPYAGNGYEIPADLVLITHQHDDHNRIDLITQKPGCMVITEKEALAGGKHNHFSVSGIEIQAVTAKNLMHNPKKCVGYLLTIDGVKIYASGDTSKTDEMKSFADLHLDYAILCGDGKYNMNPTEAAECAELIKAKHNIIIHVKPGKLFDLEKAEAWTAPNKLIVEPGQEIEL